MAVPPENAESEKHSRAAEEHSVNAAQKRAAQAAEQAQLQALAQAEAEAQAKLPKPVGFLLKALESQVAYNAAHPGESKSGRPLDPAVVPYFAKDESGKGFSARVQAGLGITSAEYRTLVAYALRNGHVVDMWAKPGRAIALPGTVKNEPAKVVKVERDPEVASFFAGLGE
jgi:hypothetical protein